MSELTFSASPELRKQWINESPAFALDGHTRISTDWNAVMDLATQYGADQELEACVEWVVNTRAYNITPGAIRAARRPPSVPEIIEVDGHTYQLVKSSIPLTSQS